jgi:hypothetical protein
MLCRSLFRLVGVEVDAFARHRRRYRRLRRDAGGIGLIVWQRGRIDTAESAPAQECQRIGIDKGKFVTEQERPGLLRQFLDALQALAERRHSGVADIRLGGFARGELGRAENVREGRMHRVVHPGE